MRNKIRGRFRGTSNNCVGEQNSNYLLRKTLRQFLLSYTGVRRSSNPPLKTHSKFYLVFNWTENFENKKGN